MSITFTYLLYYVPLIVAVSLVFGATRHENPEMIVKHSLGTARWITGFMLILILVLFFFDWIL